ncbi:MULTISPECIES: SDR family NAD(P)-dependent oxidoreductase [unclassified Sphingobium]|uniref:SDR family NAD(P)-dependent oxidoreductase n=1 Tax=unclassified Sphingobium TaxID=2611147 RepID=UPI0035A579E4
MSGRLDGKVAVITGGASGLGAAQVMLFAREGARTIIADRDREAGESLAASIAASGGSAEYAMLDVTDETSWATMVADVVGRHGALHILSNTAGIIHPAGTVDESVEGWNRILAVNQTGVFLGMRAVIPQMTAQGGGAIVNVSSLLGLIGFSGMIAYSATKGAIRIMTKAAAMEAVKQGVRINAIIPGPMKTPIQANIPPEVDAWQRSRIPMGDLGEPEDIAYGALYLASDQAKYVTGTELIIDGGWSVTT